ncbi:MAG: 16S rRNA (guanine(966)-N(2))-methyltransferase RsmD [Deltaproteobacteria bacterium]|nr:16S rRNA (guanine(966)-N(2))-methyltransferase RsmD [Deltaproteobacteria bacterium]
MRIVAGSAKGRRLCAIKGFSIRPTSDKVREAVFNILGREFHYKNVLDLFAGTGAMGIEALSRGAEHAVFVDKDSSSVRIIKKNLCICNFLEKAKVFETDVIHALNLLSKNKGRFDLIFIDPPYQTGLTEITLEMIDKNELLTDEGMIVSEISKRTKVDAKLERLCKFDTRQYGDTVVEFYRNKELT